MVEHTVIGSLFNRSLDAAIWGVGILVAVAWMCYVLGLKLVHEHQRILPIIGLLSVGSLAVWVCLALFGAISLVSLALVSGVLTVVCLVFSFDLFGLGRISVFLRVLISFFLVVLSFEVAALFLFNLPLVFNFKPELSAVASHWNLVELSFSNMAYPFLPFVYLLFVLLGVVAFVVKVLPSELLSAKFRGGRLASFVGRLRGLFELRGDTVFGFLEHHSVSVLAILASSVVSCLFVVFTVLPWTNPTRMLVSVDSPSYYQWIVHMRSVDINSALSFAFSNDRALFLVLAYGLSFLVSTVNVVQFAAAILIVLFGVVIFLVLRMFCKVRAVWIFGVLLVPFSFQSLGLIYSGYFANMLSLLFVFVYVILFFRLMDRWSSWGFLALLGISIGVLFSHSWTWFIFALSLLLFLFLELRATWQNGLSSRFRLMVVFVGGTLGVGLLCDAVRQLVSPISSTASVLFTSGSSLGLPNFGYLITGLGKSTQFVLGGVFNNSLLIFFCVIGFLVLWRLNTGISRFFVAWVFVGCMSIFFAVESFVFDRILFLMPWVVLSALGLFWGVSIVNRVGGWEGWRFRVLVTVLIFVFLILLNAALRFVFNINVW
jgi:hypothetical protein